MKNQKLWIAIGIFLLPIVARTLWFYPGFGSRPKIATPDYSALTMPTPPVVTPAAADDKVKQLGGIVLVDYVHGNQFQPGELDSIRQQVEKRGGKLELLTDASLLESHLKYASAYLVLSPSTSFSGSEISEVSAFEARGGRLAVFADATRGLVFSDYFTGSVTNVPDATVLNPLLSDFGITINNDYLYDLKTNEGNFRNVYFDQFGKSELTFGLRQVVLYGTHSVSSDSGLVLLRGADTTFSSGSDAHDAAQGGAALSADGNVVVFGDFTFLSSPYNHVADNSTLIANIADFLLGGKRTATLANFPYLFHQHVLQVYATSDVQMTAEMISALSGLQSSLQAINVSMQIVSEKPVDGDVLMLSTYSPSEDLDSISNRFNLNIESGSDSVKIPGFGKIGRAGNGVLLYSVDKKGSTLVLLTDTVDDMTALINVVSGSALSSCVVTDETAICSVGFGGSFGTPDFLGGGSGGYFGEPTPTATPGG